MWSSEVDPDHEFTPTQAFIYAVDDAIQATVLCLKETGMPEEMIWAAFRQAMSVVQRAAVTIDDHKLTERYPVAIEAL